MAVGRPYVIYTYPFDENSGGVLALHLLCDRLNAAGQRALLWPVERPRHPVPRDRTELKQAVWHAGLRARGIGFSTGPFAPRVATRRDLANAIILYPEVTEGNPLRGTRVVRWFLHQPGYHSGQVAYGPDELYFFYQDAFNNDRINPHPNHRLTLTFLNPHYHEGDGTKPREGTCHLLRKGRDRAAGFDLSGQLCIDGLTHGDTAAAFRRHRFLHSFDTYSMYSVFAAICGCIPVIEPMPGLSREAWFPNEADRYGLAYGWDDVPWAIETRPRLLDRLRQDRAHEDAMLARFVAITQARFAASNPGQ